MSLCVSLFLPKRPLLGPCTADKLSEGRGAGCNVRELDSVPEQSGPALTAEEPTVFPHPNPLLS